MYFPYLRGRQYELIALRELLDEGILSDCVVPVIEPVRLSPALIKLMERWTDEGRRLAVIGNPHVGSFAEDMDRATTERDRQRKDRFLDLMGHPSIVPACIVDKARDPSNFKMCFPLRDEGLIAILQDRDSIDRYVSEYEHLARFVLIADESAYRRRIHRNRVLFDDKFTRQARNADYGLCDDEFFSDDHLYYRDDGYEGFADYSIIGNEYSETGFAPYAVAIHIVYFDDKGSLRVKHFVSSSNDDYNNPAMKFYEAVSKLHEWYASGACAQRATLGLSGFLEHYQKQTYPGLGTVKKLSLMHHLELMNRYLTRSE